MSKVKALSGWACGETSLPSLQLATCHPVLTWLFLCAAAERRGALWCLPSSYGKEALSDYGSTL